MNLGITKEGKLNGDFINYVSLFESWYKLKIKFKEGSCMSYEMVKNAEGEISESKSSNPEVCSFDLIEDNLQDVN